MLHLTTFQTYMCRMEIGKEATYYKAFCLRINRFQNKYMNKRLREEYIRNQRKQIRLEHYIMYLVSIIRTHAGQEGSR